MTTQTIFNLVYIIGAVVILATIVPVVVKWFRRSEKKADQAQAERVESAARPEPVRQQVNEPAYAMAGASDEPESNPHWRSRLFEESAHNEAREAKLDPEDVPVQGDGDYAFGGATTTLASMLPETEERHHGWRKVLRTAGYLSPHAWQNFTAFRFLAVVIPLVLLGALLILVPKAFEIPVLIAILLVPAICWAAVGLYVRNKAADRKLRIEQGLPDAVDMLNMCVSQGLTIPQSFEKIARQIKPAYPDLAKEFQIIVEHARVGSLPQALENFADRVDVPEARSLTALLTQTDRMGTSVSQSLSDYSDSVRDDLKQRADENANKAGFKLLFPTVLCLMPAVYMFLLGPAIVELNNFLREGGRELLDDSRAAIQETGIQNDSRITR
ncbi:type II secretion system F family protein [Stratiformator vulcanicus]|uniref:Bacterial type II secretion system protein F domain protein n=1 Tax=Stratiformator vulcanicus TaxID=2527980 RepID=A0A517R2N4_9PLAN|nr:type II secretion system F family protein [Stratiformator vulcanicus]QDT38146.1 Bacterial type II secretion system protein F domain protein [Stratiformator vulcanicus]